MVQFYDLQLPSPSSEKLKSFAKRKKKNNAFFYYGKKYQKALKKIPQSSYDSYSKIVKQVLKRIPKNQKFPIIRDSKSVILQRHLRISSKKLRNHRFLGSDIKDLISIQKHENLLLELDNKDQKIKKLLLELRPLQGSNKKQLQSFLDIQVQICLVLVRQLLEFIKKQKDRLQNENILQQTNNSIVSQCFDEIPKRTSQSKVHKIIFQFQKDTKSKSTNRKRKKKMPMEQEQPQNIQNIQNLICEQSFSEREYPADDISLSVYKIYESINDLFI